MSESNKTKLYVWKLAAFLAENEMTMSGEELADHLNRNGILSTRGAEYEGKRGTYTLIRKTQQWIEDDLGLQNEADKVAEVYVLPDGTHAWD